MFKAEGYSLKFRCFFDAGPGVCLWADDDEARLRCDCVVGLDILPISEACAPQESDSLKLGTRPLIGTVREARVSGLRQSAQSSFAGAIHFIAISVANQVQISR